MARILVWGLFLRPWFWLILRGYRILLPNTTFIGVTGSSGKTTTKDLIYEILSTQYQGTKTLLSNNGPPAIFGATLRTRPWHRFCVIELGAHVKDLIIRELRLVPIDMGVITLIRLEHYSEFRDLACVAAEKEVVVTKLTPKGVAFLNADDPLCEEIATRTEAKVIRFGSIPSSNIRILSTSASWPDRLSMNIQIGQENYKIQTRLCGKHWATSIVASIAVGRSMGISVANILKAIENFEPVKGRMCPETLGDSVTFVCDYHKAAYWSIDIALEFMRAARAERKIIIIGTISDFPGSASSKYRKVCARSLECADLVIFVGKNARYAAHSGTSLDSRLRIYETLDNLLEFLNDELRPNDLVLLKGSDKADQMAEIIVRRNEWLHKKSCPSLTLNQ